MKTKYGIAIGITVFALLFGAFMGITSLVSAQGENAKQVFAEDAHRGGGENLESVAEALGITVEELQQALQNARPAECADSKPGERPAEGVNCRPDFETVASELGITVEELESAFETARQQAQAERLASAAEQLGVSVEALQSALENAHPTECANLEPGQRPVDGIDCQVDFESAASELGVSTEELKSALGRGDKGQGLENVAEALGVTIEELQQALQDAKPADYVGVERGEKPEGVDCRPDLEAAAETLGVDAEELQSALQNERGPRGHGGPNGGQPPVNP